MHCVNKKRVFWLVPQGCVSVNLLPTLTMRAFLCSSMTALDLRPVTSTSSSGTNVGNEKLMFKLAAGTAGSDHHPKSCLGYGSPQKSTCLSTQEMTRVPRTRPPSCSQGLSSSSSSLLSQRHLKSFQLS